MFYFQPEESTASTSAVTSGASTPPTVPEIQKNLTQEQLIRQQLLAKQKQLLELQQKKLELELEQTKAQLVSRIVGEWSMVWSHFV